MKEKIQIPKVFKDIFEPKRYKILSGGRGSAKSESVARYLLICAMQRKERILCTREYQVSISDSVHRVLKDIIEQYELPYFEITNNSIRNKSTGSEFIFKGLKHNINEIKSMQGITKVWIEEAQSISKQSLDVLIPTIRKEVMGTNTIKKLRTEIKRLNKGWGGCKDKLIQKNKLIVKYQKEKGLNNEYNKKLEDDMAKVVVENQGQSTRANALEKEVNLLKDVINEDVGFWQYITLAIKTITKGKNEK